jgi:hypothetical protein
MAGRNASVITEKGGHRIVVVIDGRRLETPPLEHLAFYAALGLLVAVNVVELPWRSRSQLVTCFSTS